MKSALYISFCVIATFLNILTQYVCFQTYNGKFALEISILLGTLLGLITKYILDKKFIFICTYSLKKDVHSFILYSLFGIFTTFIFWSFEYLFHVLIENEWSKYMGAIIGLSIGYILKFFLDKKFVFKKEAKSVL